MEGMLNHLHAVLEFINNTSPKEFAAWFLLSLGVLYTIVGAFYIKIKMENVKAKKDQIFSINSILFIEGLCFFIGGMIAHTFPQTTVAVVTFLSICLIIVSVLLYRSNSSETHRDNFRYSHSQ